MYKFNLLPLMYGEEPNPFSPQGLNTAVSNLPISGITIQQQKKTYLPDDVYEKLKRRELDSFKEQKQGIESFESELKAPQEINPLLAITSGLSDMFAGTNRLEALTKQKSMQEMQNKADQRYLQGMKQDLTKSEIDMLKSQFQHQQDSEKLGMTMKLAREKMATDKKGSEKMLTASETEQLADLKDQMGSLDSIYKDWKDKVGPTEGVLDYAGKKISGYIPNTDVSNYKTNLEQKAQLIGKALEGGKLTDVDFEKYIHFLPQPGDTAERAQARVNNLKDALEKKYSQRVTTFGEAGYKMGGFTPIENKPVGKAQPTISSDKMKRLEELRKKAGK